MARGPNVGSMPNPAHSRRIGRSPARSRAMNNWRAETLVPERIVVPSESDESDPSLPWNCVVWNDPVNLMVYVTYVFRKVFGYSKAKATRLMLQVHNEGRAIVSTGPLEKVEIDAAVMHRHGLWATVEQS